MDWWVCHLDELNWEDERRCMELMNPERRQTVAAMGHPERRRMSVLGEWRVKNELARRFGCPVESVVLDRTEQGKPYAVGLPVHFSLSHTGPWLALAVADRPVGIDVERLRPVTEGLARRVCSQSDWEYLLAGKDGFDPEDGEQRVRFFQIWTAKEAWYKREGTGITALRQLDYAHIPAQHFQQGERLITIVE